MRNRIAADRGTSGMFTPVSHMRGAPVVTPPKSGEPVVKWAFRDDEGHRWTGLCTVEPDVRESDHSLVTFDLARERGRGRVHG